jgi:hypothetical protein
VQLRELMSLVWSARSTLVGETYNFRAIHSYSDFAERVPVSDYTALRPLVERCIAGERDILWHGVVRNFAQSSGTSDGKSKYIPITAEGLRRNHYQGGFDAVAHYLAANPGSRLFSGKAFILGGSFANELTLKPGVKVGDLSANLIDNINPLANLVRIPSKDVALMADWTQKLPRLVEASMGCDVTNISGVPSWFLTVIKEVMKRAGVSSIHDVWQNLEVFFHGGISFEPYREQYAHITDGTKMHYLENYNASEGFFAVQTDLSRRVMSMLLDTGVFYEFVPLDQVGEPFPDARTAWNVEEGETYALVITSCNGLWRYAIGDTVKIESLYPLNITIAGRTKSFINAFGEELMVYNAEAALAKTCRQHNCAVANYTAAPVYAGDRSRGRHQWLVEFATPPKSLTAFAGALDVNLQAENSDYQAKRSGNIFLDPLEIVTAQTGVFDRWLASTGKLGGQRKVPRLCNDRKIIDRLLIINNQHAS